MFPSDPSADWGTIESDPAIFSLLLDKLGVKNAECKELVELTEESLEQLGTIFGFVFLFNYTRYHSRPQPQATEPQDFGTYRAIPTDPEYISNVFFARQLATNSCCSHALVTLCLNSRTSTTIDIGETLNDLSGFAAGAPPIERGVALQQFTPIRDAHNSFTGKKIFQISEEPSRRKGADAYHFITYTLAHGNLYEMDGLQSMPVLLKPIQQPKSDQEAAQQPKSSLPEWCKITLRRVQQRIADMGDNLEFSLIAVIEKPRIRMESKRTELYERCMKMAPTGTEDDTMPLPPAVFPADTCNFYNHTTESLKPTAPDTIDQSLVPYLLSLSDLFDIDIDYQWIDKLLSNDETDFPTMQRALRIVDANIQKDCEEKAAWKEEQELRDFNYLALIGAILEQQAKVGNIEKITKQWIAARQKEREDDEREAQSEVQTDPQPSQPAPSQADAVPPQPDTSSPGDEGREESEMKKDE
ncbi:putative Ubiquitin carboxyl-terminal hydrolase 2 [Blattamonas nauphoetae]|uniref:ubiquitinyl hydrolase 1 n=1 Tax=Blattamonas nauphoetae TaxID=2049346 RepID=A0ABQ9Y114_9EUKA|nr:putative Ubiquitin carboxyl-terminal hydrolase 2 [Blattamonas nauphoetae]